MIITRDLYAKVVASTSVNLASKKSLEVFLLHGFLFN